MSKTNCNLKFRKIWMFPRSKRKIHPWFLTQTCKLLSLENEEKWSGNQKVQNRFCSLLEKNKIKRQGQQYCSNSGGPRTYISQLKCLGLIFKKDGSLNFTRAGDQLLKNDSPLSVLQKLLLRFQYPSPYSLSIKLDPKIRVKPFIFILRLMSNESGLGYLSKSEFIIPIIYGHDFNSFNICKQKIERLRQGESITDVIDSNNDLWTPRGKDRNFEKNLVDINDIANTAKNYLQSARLIIERNENGQKVYEIDPDYHELIISEMNNEDFIVNHEDEESFQRQFGCLDRTKDTRNLIKSYEKKDKISIIKDFIQAHFLEYCGQNFFEEIPTEFIEEMKKNYGFNHNDIINAIEPIMKKSLTFFEEEFLSLAKGEGCPKKFEDSLTLIFNKKLYFNAINTSNRKRPKGVGAYADILVVDLGGNSCGLIDAKAYSKYDLPSNDYIKMKNNYILNYEELKEAKSKKLEFCLYVAGGFNSTSIRNKLNEFLKEVSTPVSAITARNLLEICNKINSSEQQSKIREIFRLGKLIERDDISSIMDNLTPL